MNQIPHLAQIMSLNDTEYDLLFHTGPQTRQVPFYTARRVAPFVVPIPVRPSPIPSIQALSSMLFPDFSLRSDDWLENIENKMLDVECKKLTQGDKVLHCIICMENEKNVIFDKCGHFSSCARCVLQMCAQVDLGEGEGLRCPICRAYSKEVKQVFVCV